MWKQPPRGFGEFALHRHAPPAPDQAQGGLQPRPVLANWQLFSGWPYRAGHTGLGFHIGGKAAALASEEVLRHFANGVVAAGVSLLLCQKLVAPTLLPLSKARPHQGYILARMAPSRLHQRQRMPGRHLGAASLGELAWRGEAGRPGSIQPAGAERARARRPCASLQKVTAPPHVLVAQAWSRSAVR